MNEIQALSADALKPNQERLRTAAPTTSQGDGYASRADRIATEYFGKRPLQTYKAPNDGNTKATGARRQGPASRGGGGLRGREREGQGERVKRGAEEEEKPEAGKIELTEDEKTYLYEKELSDAPKEVPHEPEEITLESLIGDGPAIPLGEFGMRATLTDRMITVARRRPGEYAMMGHLAKRLVEGNFVTFESEEEEKQVLTLVDEMNAEKASMLSDRKGEVVQKEEAGFETMDEGDRGKIVEKLLAGRYPAFKAGEGTLADTLRTINRNESYLPGDRDKLMKKVTELLRLADGRQQRPPPARRN